MAKIPDELQKFWNFLLAYIDVARVIEYRHTQLQLLNTDSCKFIDDLHVQQVQMK